MNNLPPALVREIQSTNSLVGNLFQDLAALNDAIQENYLTMHASCQAEAKELFEAVKPRFVQLGYAIQRAAAWKAENREAFNKAAQRQNLDALDYAFIVKEDAKDLPALRQFTTEKQEKFTALSQKNDALMSKQLGYLQQLTASAKITEP